MSCIFIILIQVIILNKSMAENTVERQIELPYTVIKFTLLYDDHYSVTTG